MNLNELIENPENPSTCTDEQFDRLVGKLKRVPLGLTAMRIAYVIDPESGQKVVISGNKRLRALKQIYGEDGQAPDEWFQDVTSMSEAERHEFIVTANVTDGSWDIERLFAQYDTSELEDLMDPAELAKLMDYAKDHSGTSNATSNDEEPNPEVKSEEGKKYDLDSNILICSDPASCDDIRKMFAQMKTGSDEDWETWSPEIEDQEQQDS